MFSIILVSHAEVASSMIDSVQMVMGDQKQLCAFEVMPGDSPDELVKLLEQMLTAAMQSGDVVVLSDFSLGTPFNMLCSLMQKHDFYHLTGMNLPMLINLLKNRQNGLSVQISCRAAIDAARTQIFDVIEFVKELSD